MNELLRSVNEAADFPSLVLAFMLVGMVLAMVQVQKRTDFDWGEAFRDDSGKTSWTRAAMLGCFIISTWVIIYIFMNCIRNSYSANDLVSVLDGALFKYFLAYMSVWSLSKPVDKLLDIVAAKYAPKT